MGRRRGVGPRAPALITLLACLAAGVVVGLMVDRSLISDRRRRLRHLGLVVLLLVAAMAGLVGDPLAQKVAARLVMPVGLIFWALFSSAGAAFVKGKRRQGAALALVWLFYASVGSTHVGAILLRSLESQHAELDWMNAPPLDAVLVLGGGSKRGPGRFELSASGDRALLGAPLYLQKKTPVLITSGHGIEGLSEEDMSEQTSEIWMSLGVPESAIVRLREPINTSQEIAALSTLIAERGFRRVGLVTSAWHLPRAIALAKRRGLDLVPIAADHRGEMPPWGPVDLVPSSDGFQKIQTGLWELMGRAVGR